MMKATWMIPCMALVLAAPGTAGELAPNMLAKFIKILAVGAGSDRKVCCSGGMVKMELGKLGITADPSAPIAWATSEAEVKTYKAAGKLVVCGTLEWLTSGGCVALVEEDGKPQIYLHMANITACKVPVSDAVLKVGKRV